LISKLFYFKNVTKTKSSNKSPKPKDYREWEKIEKALEKDLETEEEEVGEDEEKEKDEKPKKLVEENTSSSTKNKLIKNIPDKIDGSTGNFII
jgi:hypothetical protein